MTIESFGIFHGGEITKNVPNDTLDVSEALFYDNTGFVSGFGPGKQISLIYGQNSCAFTSIRATDFDDPIFTFIMYNAAGYAYLIIDPATYQLNMRINIQPNVDDIVLTKITWEDNNTGISGLTLDDSFKTISRMVIISNPLDAMDFYTDGMEFNDASFNKPLAELSILSEIIQGEMLIRSGQQFDISLMELKSAPPYGISAGTNLGPGNEAKVQVDPFRILSRISKEKYSIINTQETFISPDFDLNDSL